MRRPGTSRLSLVAEPLPECLGCERPTKRKVWDALHGLCSDCHVSSVQGLAPDLADALERRRSRAGAVVDLGADDE